MSDHVETVKVGSVTTRLSLAVELVDAVTGGRPAGSPRVRLDGVDADPVVNRSGYHLFLDLPAGDVTVRVDGGDRYVDVERAGVDTLGPDEDVDATDPADLPVETVELQPTPAYEFPSGTTLIRGTVRDAADDPVAGADVSVRHVDRTTTTTAAGEFVLFFARPFDDEDVGVSDGLLQVKNSKPTVEATHADHGTTWTTLEVAEGALTTHDLTF